MQSLECTLSQVSEQSMDVASGPRRCPFGLLDIQGHARVYHEVHLFRLWFLFFDGSDRACAYWSEILSVCVCFQLRFLTDQTVSGVFSYIIFLTGIGPWSRYIYFAG